MPTALTPTAKKVLDYLSGQGGAVRSPNGHGLTEQIAQAVGAHPKVVGHNLRELEKHHLVSRDLKARRCYTIELVDKPELPRPKQERPADVRMVTDDPTLAEGRLVLALVYRLEPEVPGVIEVKGKDVTLASLCDTVSDLADKVAELSARVGAPNNGRAG